MTIFGRTRSLAAKVRGSSRALLVVGVGGVLFAGALGYLGTGNPWLAVLSACGGAVAMRVWMLAERRVVTEGAMTMTFNELGQSADRIAATAERMTGTSDVFVRTANNLGQSADRLDSATTVAVRSARRVAKSSKRLSDSVTSLALEVSQVGMELPLPVTHPAE